jgi:hypothetical protein
MAPLPVESETWNIAFRSLSLRKEHGISADKRRWSTLPEAAQKEKLRNSKSPENRENRKAGLRARDGCH